MKSDPQVIVHLNAQLKNEITATNQYFLHYRMLKNWGLERMAKHEHDESIEEMKHADKLMDRILMLDGLPNLQDLGKLMIGESAVEILSCDLAIERGSVTVLKDGIAHCESVRDYVSRELLESILHDTEEQRVLGHVDHRQRDHRHRQEDGRVHRLRRGAHADGTGDCDGAENPEGDGFGRRRARECLGGQQGEVHFATSASVDMIPESLRSCPPAEPTRPR